MLTVAFVIQFILLIGAPILVGFWLKHRLNLSWFLFFGGALAFVAGWIITNFIPLPGEIGLLVTSIVQIGALYLVYRLQLKDVETTKEALMVGLGQGGVELILIGLFSIITFIQMVPLREATDEQIISIAAASDNIPEEEVEPSRIDELRELIDEYWSAPAYAPLLQVVQPLSILPIQMALSIVVLGALVNETLRPLLGAMALHFLSRILPIYANFFGGLFAWALLSLGLAALAVWFLIRLWPVVEAQSSQNPA
jgi:uncharacterized membrane protein YhfC